MKFEIYKTANALALAAQGGWRWRLKAANGEIIASGESYVSKGDCLRAITLVASTTGNTEIVETAS